MSEFAFIVLEDHRLHKVYCTLRVFVVYWKYWTSCRKIMYSNCKTWFICDTVAFALIREPNISRIQNPFENVQGKVSNYVRVFRFCTHAANLSCCGILQNRHCAKFSWCEALQQREALLIIIPVVCNECNIIQYAMATNAIYYLSRLFAFSDI